MTSGPEPHGDDILKNKIKQKHTTKTTNKKTSKEEPNDSNMYRNTVTLQKTGML